MPTNSSSTLAQKLLLYGVSAGTVSLAASAQAALVTTYTGSLTGDDIYFDPASGTVSTTDTTQPFSLTNASKTTTGTTPTTKYTASAGTSLSHAGIATKTKSFGAAGNFTGAENFSPGDTIGSGNQFDTTATLFSNASIEQIFASEFFPGESGYLGLEFPDPTVSGQTDYGYAGLTYNGDTTGNSFTLTSLAYDPTGAAVVVPEPSTLALLVAGAAGVAVWRRRRQQAAA